MNVLKIIRDVRGFTLFELVMSMILGGVIFGVAAETMIQQAESFSFIANRKESITDVRVTMNRMTHELLRIESSDLQNINSNGIYFSDVDGDNTSFAYVADDVGSDEVDLISGKIYRGATVLLDGVSDFQIEYLDEEGNTLTAEDTNIEEVRRIRLSITMAEKGSEGEINVTTLVTPRSFIGYANYD